MENLTDVASLGRKLQNSKGRALGASTVQYCHKWWHILIQVWATTKDPCTKIVNNVEGYNLPLRGISLRSTIRKLELQGLLWSGCPLLNFVCKKSNIKKHLIGFRIISNSLHKLVFDTSLKYQILQNLQKSIFRTNLKKISQFSCVFWRTLER